MARLRMIIEGEMTPEEMQQYIAAAWGCKVPRDLAISTVEADPPGSVTFPWDATAAKEEAPPIRESPPTPAPIPESPPATAAESLDKVLIAYKKLSEVLRAIIDHGAASDLAGVIEVCRSLQSQVPILERLGAGLEDRVTRTWAGMQ